MSELTVVRTPEIIATEINTIKDQTRRMMLYNSIEIGRKLTEAKELMPHGDWGIWLERSVSYSKSTANNLMRIFEEYGSEQITLLGDNAKSQALGNLSYTQAVALLGIPEEEREAFIEGNDVEKMSTRELQQAIKERDEALRTKEFFERQNRELKDQSTKINDERLDLKKKIAKLEKEIESAKDSGNAEEVESLQESMKTLDDELSEANQKVKELEKQLKEKPIEVPAVIEKIPNEVEKELQELRKKVGQEVVADKAFNKFKMNFEIVKKGFNGLLESLEEIQDKEKYKAAAVKYLNMLIEELQ